MIRVESVAMSYGRTEVLRDISFSLGTDRSVSIIGPSGCGKTTLLYIIAGLKKSTSGKVEIRGEEVEGPDSRMAFILQDYGLLPWKTVFQNVCLGMKIKGMDKKESAERAEKILADLGMQSNRNRFPSGLSGGEKQRVAIARALATSPEILIMDEPFSSLDTLTREKLQETLFRIHTERKFAMITVTHNIEEAVYLGDTVLVMESRPGRIAGVIKNSSRRRKGFRSSDDFFHTCLGIREIIEKK